MLLHMPVILSTGGVSISCHFLSAAWSHVPSRGSLSRWGLCPREVSVQVGLCPKRSLSIGSLCPGVSVKGKGAFVRAVSGWLVFFPGGSLCLFPCSVWGSLSRKSLFKGFFVKWEGISVQRSFCKGDPPDKDPQTVKSGWYASYWNAFLYYLVLLSLTYFSVICFIKFNREC